MYNIFKPHLIQELHLVYKKNSQKSTVKKKKIENDVNNYFPKQRYG